MRHAILPSPLGDILLGFDDEALLGLHFTDQKYAPRPSGHRDDTHPLARAAAARLERYFAGEPVAFDLPMRLAGTPFQRAVWTVLGSIPRGGTLSYAAVARQVAAPAAVRAVGAAVGRNPVSIMVPCHRVVGSDGALTGYAGGLPRKLHLLRLEGATLAGRSATVPPP
jgi:methylated-DNA-[protein]-cysteine S-methyltransferase